MLATDSQLNDNRSRLNNMTSIVPVSGGIKDITRCVRPFSQGISVSFFFIFAWWVVVGCQVMI